MPVQPKNPYDIEENEEIHHAWELGYEASETYGLELREKETDEAIRQNVEEALKDSIEITYETITAPDFPAIVAEKMALMTNFQQECLFRAVSAGMRVLSI